MINEHGDMIVHVSIRKLLILLIGSLTISACSPEDHASSVNVTNGKPVSLSEFPEVVLLSMETTEGNQAICTAVFISTSTALTAAHCILDKLADNSGQSKKTVDIIAPSTVEDEINHDEVIETSTQIMVHPKWAVTTPKVNRYDVALITFSPKPTRKFLRLSDQSLKPGDHIDIIGFGKNFTDGEQKGAGIKRVGHNVIDSLKDGLITVIGKANSTDQGGQNAATGYGDSGGPLVKDGALIGITSGGEKLGDGNKSSVFVDLSQTEMRAFLSRVKMSFQDSIEQYSVAR